MVEMNNLGPILEKMVAHMEGKNELKYELKSLVNACKTEDLRKLAEELVSAVEWGHVSEPEWAGFMEFKISTMHSDAQNALLESLAFLVHGIVEP